MTLTKRWSFKASGCGGLDRAPLHQMSLGCQGLAHFFTRLWSGVMSYFTPLLGVTKTPVVHVEWGRFIGPSYSYIPFITSRGPSFGKGDDIKEKWMLKRRWIWNGKRFFEGFLWAFSSLRESFRRDTIIYKIDTWGSQVVKMPSIEPLTKGTLGGGLWPTTPVCWGIKPNPQNVPDLFDRKVRTKTAGMFLFGSLVFS